MAKHSSVVGGSSAHRVLNCNGSIDLIKKVPPQGWRESAARGTALHEVMEGLLTDFDTMPSDYEGRVIDDIEVTKAMIEDKIIPTLDFTEDLLSDIPDEDFFLETEVHYEDVMGTEFDIEGAFGTADVLYIDRENTRAGILDFKFGENIIVDAEQNTQLKFYLAAAIISGKLPKYEEYDAYIFQPADKLAPEDYPSHTVFTFEDLIDFALDLKDAVEGPRVFEVGSHCDFCRAKLICPAYNKSIDTIRTTDIQDVNNQELAKWLDVAPSLKKLAQEIEQHALRNMIEGVRIPGYKLEKALGNRKYKDEDAAIAALGRMGLDMKERTVRKPISPAQAKKLFEKNESDPKRVEGFFKRHVTRPDNGQKIVRCDESDNQDRLTLAEENIKKLRSNT